MSKGEGSEIWLKLLERREADLAGAAGHIRPGAGRPAQTTGHGPKSLAAGRR
jgi:hypothetical protein